MSAQDDVLVWNGAVDDHAVPPVQPRRDPGEPAAGERPTTADAPAAERQRPTALGPGQQQV